MGKVDLDDEMEQENPEMIFTDRDNPRRVFWDAYDSLDRDEFFVINYYGYGGIGKSWLCKYLNDILRSGKHPDKKQKISSKSIIFNFADLKDNCDKVSVLEKLANKFENECNFKFRLFKYGLYVYYRNIGADDSYEIRGIQDNVIAAAALEVLPYVPLVGNIGSSVIKCLDKLSIECREVVLKHTKEIQELDSIHEEEIPDKLVDIFTKELRESTKKEKNPVVVFLDTYEQLQTYIYLTPSAKVSEDWLWSKKRKGLGMIRRVPNVLWVLAGQRQVAWEEPGGFWTDGKNIIYEKIEEISDEKLLTEMLKDIGIEEVDIRNIIVAKTKGVPIHLSLCKDIYFNLKGEGKNPAITDFDMGYEELAKRFIGGQKGKLKTIFQILACLESWSEEDARKMNLLGLEVRHLYEYALQHSFISSDNGIYHMDHAVRDIIYKICSEDIQKDCLAYLEEKKHHDVHDIKYENSSEGIRNDCLPFFEEKIKDESVTTGERKDYIYKKIKLQLNMVGTVLNSEDTDAIIRESLQYIREYVYDYNFFVRVKGLIEEKIANIYLKEEYKQILNIYSLYHCIIGGEYPEAKQYIEKGIISGHLKLDNDTRWFLYFSLASYENHVKEYHNARGHFLEAYDLRKESGDIYASLDLMAQLGKVCINLKRYRDVLKYSDEGIEKADEMRAKGINLDTKSVVSYCSLVINKVKTERLCGNVNKSLKYLKQAEEVLHQFDHIENEGISYEWVRIYQEYMYIYRNISREDLSKEYALKSLSAAQKAYELSSSYVNFRTLAVSYLDVAKVVPLAERKEWFDKAIEIMEELYKLQPNSATYNEMFGVIQQAADFLSNNIRNEYLNKCRVLLEKESEYKIGWTENYLFQRAEFIYNYDIERYDVALRKMEFIEKMLEEQKRRLSGLSEQDYLVYKSWNYRKMGDIYDSLNDTDNAIEYYEKENSIENKLYKDFPNYVDGTSYADSCRVLALIYAKQKLLIKAVNYAKIQIDIPKRLMDDFQSPETMQRYVEALEILADIYEQSHKIDEALAIYEEILKYAKKINEIEKSVFRLRKVFDNLRKIEKYKFERKEYDQIENEYVSMLAELADYKENRDWSKSEETIYDYMYEHLKFTLGRIWYIQGRKLDKAWEYIQSSNSDDLWFDKWFYTGKIEKVLLDYPESSVYLTKEEGIRLLSSN